MPRYQINDRDLDALVTYLETLGLDSGQGVTDDEITIATVISADAPEAERLAVTEVLGRFLETKNGGSRREDLRAAAARRHPYGLKHARAYRKWRLVTWTLDGPVSDWQRQLEEQYVSDPAFAVVSGTTGHDWQVVQDFCESQKLPCILPLADAPPNAEDDFYSIHFSSGARLESRIAARHIADSSAGGDARILVVRQDDEASRVAFAELQVAWQEMGKSHPVQQLVVPLNTPPDDAFWRGAIDRFHPDALLVWLPANSMASLTSSKAGSAIGTTPAYTLEAFTDWQHAEPALAGLPNILHVYPYRISSGKTLAFPREELWLRAAGLSHLDVRLGGKVLFACHAFGEALSDTLSNFSREYLVEELEHMLDGTSMTTLFPRTSIGPGQRLLIRGAYVLAPSALLSGTPTGATWVDL